MKCSKCGSAIEGGQVFCPKCGNEIQLVPDYISNQVVSYAQKQKQREIKERERKRREEAEALERKLQARRRRKKIGITVLVLVILAGAVVAFKSYQEIKNYNSYDYQLSKAETCFTNNEYEEAQKYAERAIELNPSSLDAKVLSAQIYAKDQQSSKAIRQLEDIIAENNDYTAAYGPLIRLYENEGQSDKIKELLDACESDTIKEKYEGYICNSPVFSIPEGDFTEELTLTLSADNASETIYYTTDGSTPDQLSKKYMSPILLTEGTTTIKAVAVNEKEIRSDVVSMTYEIELATPDVPKITPASGEFLTNMENTKIYVIVPNGCKAYYAFDKEATIEDTLYEGPVDMPEGEHVFYAILVNEYGKTSAVSSASYTMKPAASK